MADYRKLRVYPKAHRLAVAAYKASQKMSGVGSSKLQDQIMRSALSIPANIIEGCDHESAAEFLRYLLYSRASSSELQGHIKFARDIGMIPQKDAVLLNKRIKVVRKMLSGLIRKVRLRVPPDKRKRRKK
jgi:four helix bundle protein